MKRIRAGIIGHTGRLGKPLAGILQQHPYAEIVYTKSRKKGINGNLTDAELVFLALPAGESGQHLPKLKGKRIIDLSQDNRYKRGWVYGIPELNKNKIKNAERIANPGCYATSIILGLAPLKGLLSNVTVSSISGISGAGKRPEKEDNLVSYDEGNVHSHIPEIKKTIGLEDLLFVPIVDRKTDRGIMSTIFAKYTGNEKDLQGLFREFYRNAEFVRIKFEEESIETKNVIGTNYCDIKVMRFGEKVLIISALDNIIKGGIGTAIQNFNLMYGFEESTGITKNFRY